MKTLTWVGFSQAEATRGNSKVEEERAGRLLKKLWSPGRGKAGTPRGDWRNNVPDYADSSVLADPSVSP